LFTEYAPNEEQMSPTKMLARKVLASELVDRLTAPHGIDRYLELINPAWTVRTVGPVVEAPARGPIESSPVGSSPTDVDPGDGAIRFSVSAVAAPSLGTVLETAEAAGLTPKNRCRRGICGTCTSTKSSGIVRNTITGELSTAGAESFRPCVSIACGDVVVEL
jgi:ferredoxin